MILAFLFALLNAFRGRGLVPADRWLACAGMGAAAGVYAGSRDTGVAVAVGTYLWALPSWGVYFECITGVDLETRLRRMLGMSARGLLIVPMFAALAFITGNPWALAGGLVGLLQGPCYFVMRYTPNWQEWAVARAELLFGMAMGAAVACVLA